MKVPFRPTFEETSLQQPKSWNYIEIETERNNNFNWNQPTNQTIQKQEHALLYVGWDQANGDNKQMKYNKSMWASSELNNSFISIKISRNKIDE